ncbi:hypothetical protein [Dyella sp.]|uniref:hypothetical protein n=1 Tax=Dyella sp. TaxID=1869338 RepID=UPI002FD9EF15
MATQSKSNPYRGLSRRTLYDAAQKRAGELMQPGPKRTAKERAALALDTAHLLLVLAGHVDTKEFASQSPRKSIREGKPLAEAFAELHSKLASSTRYAVFVDAADAALGEERQRSVADSAMVHSLYHAAVASDEGLVDALAKLQELHERRRRKR